MELLRAHHAAAGKYSFVCIRCYRLFLLHLSGAENTTYAEAALQDNGCDCGVFAIAVSCGIMGGLLPEVLQHLNMVSGVRNAAYANPRESRICNILLAASI